MPRARSRSPAPRARKAAKLPKPSEYASRSFLRNLWEFLYPHTIIGTVLSIVVNTELALRDHSQTLLSAPGAAYAALATALVSALLMNGYIVGINQCFDVEIDRLNKPYLPLASGAWSMDRGWTLVALFGTLSLLIAALAPASSAWLLGSVALSGVLGTAYSVDLPLLRWKANPLLASSCILTVRGFVVQVGFYEHAVAAAGLCDGGAACVHWNASPVLCLSIVFVTMLSFAIAFCKDVPDIAGDVKGGVRTLPVRLGASNVLRIVYVIMLSCYAVAVGRSCASVPATVAHAALAVLTLWRAHRVDAGSVPSIRSFYMHVWTCFYLEYVVLLLALDPGHTTFGAGSPLESAMAALALQPPAWAVAPLLVAALARARSWLTPGGTAAGLAIGLVVARSGLASSAQLLAFFAAASIASKYRRRAALARRPRRAGASYSHTTGSAADEAKVGRNAWQALATGAIPALLSTGAVFSIWRPAFLAYLACGCGDTLASELGSLSAQPPVALRGVDGGVTFAGAVASLAGGALVGACDLWGEVDQDAVVLDLPALPGAARSALLGALLGFTGSALDSVLGSVLQGEGGAAGLWGWGWSHKALNTLVNLLSSVLNVGVGAVLWARPAEAGLLLLFVMSLQLLLLAPGAVPGVTPWHTRKGLHVITSALVLALDARARAQGAAAQAAARLLVQVVGSAVLLALIAARDVFRRFDTAASSAGVGEPGGGGGRASPLGIPLFTAAVVTAVTAAPLLGLPLRHVCGPMFFADPLAAVVGRAVPSSHLLRGKTIAGSVTFFAVCTAWFWASHGAARATLLAAALAAAELLSGDLDNIVLVLASGALLLLI
eukprot:g3204.t1